MRLAISGLALRFVYPDDPLPSALAGPLIYAALGAALTGTRAELLGVLSEDLDPTEAALLEEAGVSTAGTQRRPQPSLHLVTGRRSTSSQSLIGQPLAWSPSPRPPSEPYTLFAAAGDPCWLHRNVQGFPPRFLGVDLHMNWIRARPRETAAVVRSCDFLSAAENELGALPPECLKAARERGTVILTKKGAGGANLEQWGQVISLPPATMQNVRSEIGAGDLLFGALHRAALAPPNESLRAFAQAYLDSLWAIRKLLRTRAPADLYAWAARVLRNGNRARHAPGPRSAALSELAPRPFDRRLPPPRDYVS